MTPNAGKIVVRCPVCLSFFKVSTSLSHKKVICTKCRRPFVAQETNYTKTPEDKYGFFLCKIALNYGFINDAHLEAILKTFLKKSITDEKPCIERLLVSKGDISEDNLLFIKGIYENWSLRQAEKKLAGMAVKMGFIDQSIATEVLFEQARLFSRKRAIKLVTDILSEKGHLTTEQKNCLLEQQGLFQQSGKKQTTEKNNPISVKEKQPFFRDRQKTIASAETVLKKQISPSVSEKDESKQLKTEVLSSQPYNAPTIVHTEEKKLPYEEKKSDGTVISDNNINEHFQQEASADEPAISEVQHDETQEKADTPEKKHEDLDVEELTAHDEYETDQKKTDILQEIEPEQSRPSSCFRDSHPTICGIPVFISNDCLTATLKVPQEMDISGILLEDIKDSLREIDIVYGIAEDSIIKGFLSSAVYREKPFIIAEGRPAEPGKNGNINFFFDTDYLKVGEVTESGEIDFKNRGEIPYVNAGTILAEIIQAVPGKNGKDIFGRDLLVSEVKNAFIKCEKGVELSDDGRRVIATASGQPKLSFGNRLHVLTEIVIPGDVGYETGHVEFDGNITIKGSVLNDFKVKGSSVTAEEILEADIAAKGNLMVKTGISGANLDVEGDINAKFINRTTIKAYGNIVVDREIIDCKIQTSGAVICRGKIVTSAISARQGVEAMDIGTDISAPCHIRIGVDDHILHEVSLIDDEIEKLRSTLESNEDKLKELIGEEKSVQKKIAELAHIQDRSLLEQKSLEAKIEQTGKSEDKHAERETRLRIETLVTVVHNADSEINVNFDRQESINTEIRQTKERIWDFKERIMGLKKQKQDKLDWAEKIGTKAYVKTKGPVYSGTVISGKFSSRTLNETMRAVRIHEAVAPSTKEGWEIRVS